MISPDRDIPQDRNVGSYKKQLKVPSHVDGLDKTEGELWSKAGDQGFSSLLLYYYLPSHCYIPSLYPQHHILINASIGCFVGKSFRLSVRLQKNRSTKMAILSDLVSDGFPVPLLGFLLPSGIPGDLRTGVNARPTFIPNILRADPRDEFWIPLPRPFRDMGQ